MDLDFEYRQELGSILESGVCGYLFTFRLNLSFYISASHMNLLM